MKIFCFIFYLHLIDTCFEETKNVQSCFAGSYCYARMFDKRNFEGLFDKELMLIDFNLKPQNHYLKKVLYFREIYWQFLFVSVNNEQD